MATKLTVDRAGRIVIPKTLRMELDLAPGDSVELDREGDQMVLRPARSHQPLQKERGVWVFRSGERLRTADVLSTLRRVREERVRQSLGREA